VKVDLAALCSWAAELAWHTGAAPRAVELAPAQPPSPERAQVLAILGNALMVPWRYDESVTTCEQALALARAVGARPAEFLALRALGGGLAYLGRGDEGLTQLWLALRLAEERSDPMALMLAYNSLTDVLTMLGRPHESARLAATALEALHRYGIDRTTLVANQVEALVAIGEWDQADRVSAAA
jgi:tetratricopeptide (TPR) repeat protein